MPAQLLELTARIGHLSERLRQGDHDLDPDELQAAIDRAEAKRRDLEGQEPAARASARMLAMLPRAAEEFRKQLALGLKGSEQDVLRARVALQRHFGGEIRLVTEPGGGLVARWNEPVGAVFQAAQVSVGSGGALPTNSTVIIPFLNTDLSRRVGQPPVPSYCGNGHPLVRENLAISDSRWRCRRCGAARAARFRARR